MSNLMFLCNFIRWYTIEPSEKYATIEEKVTTKTI